MPNTLKVFAAMTHPTKLIASIAALLLATAAMSAHGAVQTFTSESTFNTNATGVEVRNFEGIATADPGFVIVNDRPLLLPSLGSAPNIFVDSNASANNVLVLTGGQDGGFSQAFFVSQNFGPINEITMSVANPGATALGFIYGSTAALDSPFSITVIGSGGAQNPLLQLTNLQLPATVLTPAFIGFTSSAPITSIIFSANDVSHLNLLQVSVGTALLVPEASTYAMFGAGLALFGMIGRRRSRKQ